MRPDRPPRTPNTAVVLLPPEDLWGPIRAIRATHDAHVRRWMPHITLLFPFVPADRFAEVEPVLASACSGAAAFRIRLGRFEYFPGPRTVWLDPEPGEPVRAVQAAVQRAFPTCDDVSRFPGRFRPHLSVGQGPPDLRNKLQEAWSPIDFEVREVALIQRDGPDDPFRVHQVFPLNQNSIAP